MKNKWTLDSRFKNTNLNANLKAQIRIRAAPHHIEAKKSNNSKLRTPILDLKKKRTKQIEKWQLRKNRTQIRRNTNTIKQI